MARSPAKKPTKKLQAPAVMLVVMKESEDGNGNGKKMRGKGGCGDMEEYRKGGMVKRKKGCK